ncbi:hypothetical protein JHL18_02490 [Clostridium sp. YIM B02505]|uniref:Uncharacterized protein n=1 Tax=Clostridium yunnanense TaxID=2800325 RepID=A0ABS1EJG9_9CLOT|nr:hypothetical protein [Clostridium yunnanense]MBK1809513.1 hypothetical protein [Clostridium yunnanense]
MNYIEFCEELWTNWKTNSELIKGDISKSFLNLLKRPIAQNHISFLAIMKRKKMNYFS